MRHLITSLQGHNSQLKTEVNRLKKKLKEAGHEINKLRHEKNDFLSSGGHPRTMSTSTSGADSEPRHDVSRQDSRQSGSGSDKEGISPVKLESGIKVELVTIKDEPCPAAAGDGDVKFVGIKTESESTPTTVPIVTESKEKAFNELKLQHQQLKNKHESLKSMYESSQNKIKDLKKQLANLGTGPTGGNQSQASSAPGSGQNVGSQSAGINSERRPNDDVQINKLKDKIRQLEKQAAQLKSNHQQQEEALLNEMEMTGSAFENMQEMNLRLVQQLREKDDANFKLMSERIKSQQIQKLLKEEKESLTEQVISLQAQVSFPLIRTLINY